MIPILTINSKNYMGFDLLKSYCNAKPEEIHKSIKDLHLETVEILKHKRIKYLDLKPALIPQSKKQEAAYIFDTKFISSSFYGLEVFNAIMPYLDKETTQSIKAGDLIGKDQLFIKKTLEESMIKCRNLDYIHSTSFYCIYMNNLTKKRMELINENLKTFNAYIGYIPTIKEETARYFLSSSFLVSFFLKHKSIVITSHEDDRSNFENVNMGGYPFEKYGYKQISIKNKNFAPFLQYKIERPIMPEIESDSEISILSVSNSYLPIEECEIIIEKRKHEFLLKEKFGSLSRAKLEQYSTSKLTEIIREKIKKNYIYEMTYLEEYDVIKFCILMEFAFDANGFPKRLEGVFKYNPINKTISLTTMY
jgi:hypothetical protein